MSETEYYIIDQVENEIYSIDQIVHTFEFTNSIFYIVKREIIDEIDEHHSKTSIGNEDLIIFTGLMKLISYKLDCINLSVGYEVDHIDRDRLIEQIFEHAIQNKIFPVVAVGNSGPASETFQSLAKLNSTIIVGATDKFMELQDFSSRGKKDIDYNLFVTNGILSESYIDYMVKNFGEKFSIFKEGTSFSTPIVTSLVCGIKKFYQILDFLIGVSFCNEPNTKRLHFGVIGFADTASSFPMDLNSREIIDRYENGRDFFFNIKFTKNEINWIKIVFSFLAQRKECFYIVVALDTIVKFMIDFAIPLDKYKKEDVGHGYVSLPLCIDYLSKLKPSVFVKHFSTLPRSSDSDKELQQLDKNLGSLFKGERLKKIVQNCFINQLAIAEKII